jgi:addiction module HigA family antidote
MFKNGMRLVHPGEVLKHDHLIPLARSATALARALHVPPPRGNDVVRGRRGVPADAAMRLPRQFGGDARSWLNRACVRPARGGDQERPPGQARGRASGVALGRTIERPRYRRALWHGTPL